MLPFLLLALPAQHEAEALDLIDLLDAVDPVTRAEIEAAIERGEDLGDLALSIADGALTPRSRDGAIGLFARFEYERWWEPPRTETAVLLGLALDFDELLPAPEPYGDPPEERWRYERCRALARRPVDRLQARADEASFEALACRERP